MLTNGISWRQRERLEPRQAQLGRHRRDLPRLVARGDLGEGADVVGRRAAAAADDVDQPLARKGLDLPRHELRALVVAAEFVGQAGVGIGHDEGVGDVAELGDVRRAWRWRRARS